MNPKSGPSGTDSMPDLNASLTGSMTGIHPAVSKAVLAVTDQGDLALKFAQPGEPGEPWTAFRVDLSDIEAPRKLLGENLITVLHSVIACQQGRGVIPWELHPSYIPHSTRALCAGRPDSIHQPYPSEFEWHFDGQIRKSFGKFTFQEIKETRGDTMAILNLALRQPDSTHETRVEHPRATLQPASDVCILGTGHKQPFQPVDFTICLDPGHRKSTHPNKWAATVNSNVLDFPPLPDQIVAVTVINTSPDDLASVAALKLWHWHQEHWKSLDESSRYEEGTKIQYLASIEVCGSEWKFTASTRAFRSKTVIMWHALPFGRADDDFGVFQIVSAVRRLVIHARDQHLWPAFRHEQGLDGSEEMDFETWKNL